MQCLQNLPQELQIICKSSASHEWNLERPAAHMRSLSMILLIKGFVDAPYHTCICMTRGL